ncbi:MAG: hypothetical protein R3F51_20395 [Cyanobacteriota/Melainabacteria group bacterium]
MARQAELGGREELKSSPPTVNCKLPKSSPQAAIKISQAPGAMQLIDSFRPWSKCLPK